MQVLGAALVMMMAEAAMAQAQGTPAMALLVLAKKAQMLSIVDPATLQVVGKGPMG